MLIILSMLNIMFFKNPSRSNAVIDFLLNSTTDATERGLICYRV